VRRDLLTALCEIAGPSGREERIRALVRPELEETCDRVVTDPLGGLTGVRDGAGGPRLMLAAHMDEIGLIVTHIDERGYLRVAPLGGWDARTLVGQRVMVHGREDLPGIVGTTPVHLLDEAARQKAPRLEDLAVDTGLPADRVRALVRQGDVITRTRTLEQLGELVTGKSLDNRVGVFVMLEAMHAAQTSPAEVHAAATVQEEVGLRGAKVTATRIAPDIAVAIDTCPADDGPGTPSSGPSTRLGHGTAIRVMDASAICSPALVDLLVDQAERRGIPYQFHVANRGGTDTQSIQLAGEGAIAGCVSIPTRYVHSSVEACHPADIQASIDLVAALIEHAHELMPT
jgi:tetrahedral aminopeptidase